MAKPNYSFDKRQREMANKKKKEEKRQNKLMKNIEKNKVSSTDNEDTANEGNSE